MIEVLDPGVLTTVQDLGRPGLAHLGVPPSGAADRDSLLLANRLVGNHDGAAALEATLRGPKLRFAVPAVFALAGGDAKATLAGRDVRIDAALAAAAGDVLDVGEIRGRGVRTYLAVRGGIAASPTLGSRSHDLLTSLGPPPLRSGDVLPIGAGAHADVPSVAPMPTSPQPEAAATLRILLGPRDDWFTDEALGLLTSQPFAVTAAANRVGVMLEGPRLERGRSDELLSEGMVTGSLQVPPSGHPILLLSDHPTTGGYPVIAVVVSSDVPLAGQLRPGSQVRFHALDATRDRG